MSKNRKRVTENFVQYYILVKNEEIVHKLGSIKIDKFNGDMYYFPSFDINFKLSDKSYSEIRKIKHLSFHKSGEFHIKVEKGKGDQKLSGITDCIMELGKGVNYGGNEDVSITRTPIRDIKIQNMFQLFIKDFQKLELFQRKIEEIDLLFDISNMQEKDNLLFNFSMISGKLINHHLSGKNIDKKTKLKSVPCDIVINRCLGNESGNADKLLQYSISKTDKCDFDGNINLRFFYDNPINKTQLKEKKKTPLVKKKYKE